MELCTQFLVIKLFGLEALLLQPSQHLGLTCLNVLFHLSRHLRGGGRVWEDIGKRWFGGRGEGRCRGRGGVQVCAGGVELGRGMCGAR